MKEQKLIYVIDGNDLVGLDIRQKLEKAGYIVRRMGSLTHAKEAFDQKQPDLIIADALVQQNAAFDSIKPYFEKDRTPLICVSTSDVLKTLKACPTINIISVFEKPFDSKDLINLVNDYLN